MKKSLFFFVLALLLVACGESNPLASTPAPATTSAPVVQTVVVEKVVTAQAMPTVLAQASKANQPQGFMLYDSAGGVPYNGTSWSADVAPDEIEVFTAGPACIAGVCLPGGTNRGSVIILLPGKEVIPYTVTDVIAGANWHGSYRPLGDPSAETTWRALANDRVAAMKVAPNCTPGRGCNVVDVLIVGPSNVVVAQWVVQ